MHPSRRTRLNCEVLHVVQLCVFVHARRPKVLQRGIHLTATNFDVNFSSCTRHELFWELLSCVRCSSVSVSLLQQGVSRHVESPRHVGAVDCDFLATVERKNR